MKSTAATNNAFKRTGNLFVVALMVGALLKRRKRGSHNAV